MRTFENRGMNEQSPHISYEAFVNKLAAHLKKLRSETGLSQERIAYDAFLSPFTYLKFERGESNPGTPMNPRLHTLLALADSFGINILELLDVDEDEIGLSVKPYTSADGYEIPNYDAETFTQKLADRMQKLRWERDMTKEDVARLSGITYRSYSCIEKGELRAGTPANPRLSTLISIANAFGVSLIDLLSVDR